MSQKKFLDKIGLQNFLNRIKALIPTKTSELQNDSGFITSEGAYDSALSLESEKAVQNKVVTAAINGKQDTLSTAQTNAVDSGITSAKVQGYDSHISDTDIHVTQADKTSWDSKAPGTHTHLASEVSGLSTVATSGSYNDLSNKPSIPSKTSDLTNDSGFLTSHNPIDSSLSSTSTNAVQNKVINTELGKKANTTDLATVATSGSYADLTNKPAIPTVNNATLTIQKNGSTVNTFTANSSTNVTADITVPTKVSELTNDSGFLTSHNPVDSALSTTSENAVQNKVVKAELDNKANSADLSTVATTGNYTDLNNIPSNFTPASHTHGSITNDGKLGTASRALITDGNKKIAVSSVTSTELGYLSGVTSAVQDQLDGKAASTHSHTASEVSGLATVATSGSYNDLTNKPTIPTVNNATLTIQKNGTTVKTFTANASANVTANITVPTKVSELTNDSGFLTSHNPVDSALSDTSTNAVQNKVVKAELDGKSDTGHTHTASEVSGLSTVATSGSYNDLTNKPTIPTVNNATLTIQKNGTTVKTFTANASSNVTANITVPTKVSELTNDSGFLTSASNLDSSKLTGTIDIARLPKGALERLITVADQTARFALTTSDVQLGDTVKQLDTGVMYIVTDETKLSSADGYTEYTAGAATSVPWSGVTGKPSSYTPASHSHGNIANGGTLGTASRALITDGNKKITTSSVTSTELGYVSGVTSAIQTQLNGKAPSSHTHTASEVSGLSTVATSGSYNDLTNKPTIDSALSSTSTNAVQNKVINSALAGKAASSHTHTKSQITDFPTKTSQFTNDSHQTITVGTDTTSTASPAHSGTFTCIDSVTRDSNGHVTAVNTKTVTLPADNNTDTLVTQNVSTANENHPVLLTVTKDATANQGAKTSIFASGVKVNPSTNTVTATTFSGALSGNASSATQFSANKSVTLTGDVTGTASSKAGWSVATTLSDSGVTAGTYGPSADVTGNNNATISVPEITVDSKGRVTSVANRTLTCKNNTYNVYNKTLTIQKNGTNVATFTSNSNTDVTANITVPTKTSELTNDSGYLTSHQSLSNYVTLNGSQTVTGAKTFTGGVTLSNTAKMTVNHATVVKGTNPSSVQYWQIFNCDKNGGNWGTNTLSIIEGALDANGKSSIYFRACKNEANSTASGTLAVVYDSANNKTWAECPTPDASSNDTKIATTAWVNSKGYLTSHQSLSNYSTLANTVKSLSISGKTITVTPGSGNAYTLTTQDTVYTHPTTAGNKHIPSGGSSGQFLGWNADGSAKWVNNPNTDTKVTQNVSTTNSSYPILCCPTADATANQGAKTSIFGSGVKINPYYSQLFAGNYVASGMDGLRIRQAGSGKYSTIFRNDGAGTYILVTNENDPDGSWNDFRPLHINNATGICNITGNVSGSSGSCTGNAATSTNATNNANGKELSNSIIKGLSVSGKTITYTQIDGTTGTITTQDTNTDTLMTQNVSTTNATYPILLCATANATANQGAKTGIFGSGVKVNPSTSTISATTFSGSLSGNAATSSGLITNTGIVQNGITYTGGSYYIGTSAGQLYKGSSNNAALISAPENGTFWAETSGNVQNLRFTWSNDGKYLHDIFVSPNNNYIWHRDVVNGTAKPWRRVVEENATGLTDQTWSINIGGNAATATQFSANKSVTLTGDVTGTASSKAGWSVATTLANSGVTAGTYGPSADVTGNNNATISVPQITVDAKGRVTSVVNKTLTCKNNTYTVNNATLTIQKNGTNVATFTSNASANATANITVPTKVSELTNDLKYTCSLSGNAINFDWSTQYSNKVGIKVDNTWVGGILTTANTTIPTKTSQLTNDSGFLTSHQSLANYVTLNGAQTISGQKIFTAMPAMRNTVYELGATPSSNQFAFLEYFDKNAVQTGWIGRVAYTNGYDSITISCANRFTNGAKATDGTRIDTVLEVALSPTGVRYLNTNAGWMSSVYPMTNEGANLGTTTARWNQIYAKGGSFSYGLDCGCIELNVSQGRSDGGLIDFHYNQSSADYTSRIIENSSGKLDINGVGFPIGAGKILAQTGSLVKGTNPSAHTWLGLYFNDKTYNESATHRIATIEPYVGTNGTTGCYMRAYNWVANDQTAGSIAIHYPLNGTPYTEAPTPATSDNSTKIATTAYVKAQGYLTSHQSLSNYVTLNGAQTITGSKTFTHNVALKNTAITNHKEIPSSDISNIACTFWSNDNKFWGAISHNYLTTGHSVMRFEISNWTTSGSQGWWALEHGVDKAFTQVYFRSGGSGYCNLGDASHTWKGTYSQEFHAYNNNAFMAKSGDYTFLIRNDGGSTYFLMSEQNGNEGTWSNARPLTINNASGICDINGSCGGTSHGLRSSLTMYGDSVTYSEGQLTVGTAAGNAYKGSSNNAALISFPENGTAWSTSANVQNLRLAWSGDWQYWHDIFVSPNNDYIWHRNVTGRTARGWRRVVEENVSGLTNQTWSINIGGTSANVTGTVAIANGGTGATSRLNAVKNLTNENVGTGTQYFLTITSNWGKAGYCSVADAKTVLSVPTKTSQLTNDSGFLTSHQDLSLYPYKLALKTSSDQHWPFRDLGDTTTYPNGFNDLMDTGKYDVRAVIGTTPNAPSITTAPYIQGILEVEWLRTTENTSSYKRIIQKFHRVGPTSAYDIFIRRAYLNSSSVWVWADWEQVVTIEDIPKIVFAYASRSAITDAGNGSYKRASAGSLYYSYFVNGSFTQTTTKVGSSGTYELQSGGVSQTPGTDKICGLWIKIA